MARRMGLGVVLLAMGVLTAMTATADTAAVRPGPGGRFDLPMLDFAAPGTVLRTGTPASAGLDPAPIETADGALDRWTEGAQPLFPGAVSLLVHNGVVVDRHAVGNAVRYADATTELPPSQRVAMRADTIFDVASVSKLFTSIAVLCLIDDGKVRLDERVATYLPEFGVNGKQGITVQQLLTHTSGLEPDLPLWRDWPDKASRIKAVMDHAPSNPPGSTYTYSDLNLITLGVLVERVGGRPLDAFVADRITTPLGLKDTGYNPPAAKLGRIAATEYETAPPRGMVRGQVHDENAWSLGGVSGHAGVFSTADDLAVLGQMILNGGTYRGARVLREDAVRRMLTNYNSAFPDDAHGLGVELDQRWYMGGLSGPRTAGHTGFTGTSLVVDPASRSIAILLTNRVHPTRSGASINPARQAVATGLARALAVRSPGGGTHWSSLLDDNATATLTTPTLRASGPPRISFQAFVDTDAGDGLVVETSGDGTAWRPVTARVRGVGAPTGPVVSLSGSGHRSWWTVNATAPVGGDITLRWRFTTDSHYTGRGVIIDRIVVTDGSHVLLNGEKEPHLLRPLGWRPESR
ncbi:serine hydrolase domain-containing protein [Actinokineospora enzanensis]|uniref:serine hydrolase domain-containing protein n=1 Tax=Actinokineospora enzanensis TaxID=155975 RepID=UPI0003A32BDA|nr:serine hydrolase domain-containing protein [Actinokineospora enzanensis]